MSECFGTRSSKWKRFPAKSSSHPYPTPVDVSDWPKKFWALSKRHSGNAPGTDAIRSLVERQRRDSSFHRHESRIHPTTYVSPTHNVHRIRGVTCATTRDTPPGRFLSDDASPAYRCNNMDNDLAE